MRLSSSSRFSVTRACAFTLCLVLLITSQPIAFFRSAAFGQNPNADKEEKGLRRQTIPDYQLPDLNAVMDEGKKEKRTELPRPALKPSTDCGFRDGACREKKAKEKIGQNLMPKDGETANQISRAAPPAPPKNQGSWRQRLGQWFGALANAGATATGFTARQPLMAGSGTAASGTAASGTAPGAAASNLASGAVAAVACPTPYPNEPATVYEALTDPRYRTGGESEDLYSGNFHSSVPLVSLPGRAGMDLNVTLHYNSLVWMRYTSGGTQRIVYDPDYYASLTPGFRLGFPELDGPLMLRGVSAYVLTLPSGRHIEMRNIAPNVYEAIDSSYFYLVTNPSASPKPIATLFSADGMRYCYIAGNDNVLRVDKVLDRNGNCIKVNYKTLGNSMIVLDTIVDSLNRTITFNYDIYFHLLTITQSWANNQTFTWAQFTYETKQIQTTFEPCLVPEAYTNNSFIPVITRVITGDGARHVFVYNSWGQVDDLWTYGEADNQRAASDYVFPANTTMLSDCPRFSQRNDKVVNWAGASGDGWVATNFAFNLTEPSGKTAGKVTAPNNVEHKEIFDSSGAFRGLTCRTETRESGANGTLRQFTDYVWQGDGVATSFPPIRPRLIDTKVCDDRNGDGIYNGTDKLRRTTMTYINPMGNVRLPETIKEYNEGGATVYRARLLDYSMTSTADYVSNTRRIIGLPYRDRLFAGDLATLIAQTDYCYDQDPDGVFTAYLTDHGTVSQHEGASNQPAYQNGVGKPRRGNLNKVLRWSVTGGTASAPITYRTAYNSTGTVACSTDGIDTHKTNITYNDAFTYNIGLIPGSVFTPATPTYAYPTRVQDPDTFTSMVKFNYDHGGVTEQIDPKSYAGTQTTKVCTLYDTKGRVERTKVVKDNADYSYTRNVYSNDHNWMQSYSTVRVSPASNNTNASEETFVLHLLDGASRERITISEHPGSAGTLKSQYVVYDFMGRVSESSNPTEINGNWAPWGDDSTGYKVSTQAYDWKSRPTTTTNQDLSTRSLSYDGCGCAGSDIVTALSEPTQSGGANRRKATIWRDVFGRTIKTQTFNYSTGSVYNTNLTEYDVRDLPTCTKQLKDDAAVGAACPLGTCQQTDLAYDGYARLQKQYLPIYQDNNVTPPYNGNASARSMMMEYNNDGTLLRQTDPRRAIISPLGTLPHQFAAPSAQGPTTTYGYNNRGLVTSVVYATPDPANIPKKPDVFFGYDQQGKRTSMTDVAGTVTYTPDSLGRTMSETRVFNQTSLPGSPAGSFAINYDYYPGGQLKLVRDPFNDQIDYGYDKAGQLLTVTGGATAFAGQSNFPYVSGVQYRAWGALKNNRTYDNRLRLTSAGNITYSYNAASDMTLAQMSIVRNSVVIPYDQTFGYDHVGRLTGVSTPEISAPTEFTTPLPAWPATSKVRPFTTGMTYDEFGNVTGSGGTYWHDTTPGTTVQVAKSFYTTVVNGRAKKDGTAGKVFNTQDELWQYNNRGQVYADTRSVHNFDNGGQTTKTIFYGNTDELNYAYDGDGRMIKFLKKTGATVIEEKYRIYSNVLGGLLTEIGKDTAGAGKKLETRV